MAEWISPTSHSGTWYSNPTNAYDGDTGTYATMTREASAYLHPATFISCSKIRVWASILNTTKADLTISVYYSGGYHELFDGQLSTYTDWVEIAIGSTQTVEHALIVSHSIVLPDCLHEFEFWKEADAPTFVYGDGALKATRIFQRM